MRVAIVPVVLAKRIIFFLCVFVLMFGEVGEVGATTFEVSDGDVYGPSGLMWAIETANMNGEADVINLYPGGDYVLTHVYNTWDYGDIYEAFPSGSSVITTEIVINGNGATIRRDVNSLEDFRVLTVKGGKLRIYDLTISGGLLLGGAYRSTYGGGIYNGGGELTVVNSEIVENGSYHGGGIANSYGGVLTVINSEISDNVAMTTNNAQSEGGGIYAGVYHSDEKVLIVGSRMVRNSAFYGGAIFSSADDITIEETAFSLNSAVSAGGAIYVGTHYAQGRLSVENSVFDQNSAYSGGAIISVNPIEEAIVSSRFDNNNGRWGAALLTAYHPNAFVAGGVMNVYGSCFSGDYGEAVVYNNSPFAQVNAMYNWWGAADGPSGDGDGTGVKVEHEAGALPIIFTPFLTGGCPLDNQAPVANAGSDQMVFVNEIVELDGSQSSDPNSDPLTYSWSVDDGLCSLDDPSIVNPVVSCTEKGVYYVTLTVSDGSQSDTDSLALTVRTASDAIIDLIDLVESFNLQQGIDNSLDAKLEAALNALDDLNENNDVAAINTLSAFINAVEAQRGDKITESQADALVAAAQAIIDYLSL